MSSTSTKWRSKWRDWEPSTPIIQHAKAVQTKPPKPLDRVPIIQKRAKTAPTKLTKPLDWVPSTPITQERAKTALTKLTKPDLSEGFVSFVGAPLACFQIIEGPREEASHGDIC